MVRLSQFRFADGLPGFACRLTVFCNSEPGGAPAWGDAAIHEVGRPIPNGLDGEVRRTVPGAKLHIDHRHACAEFNLVVRGVGVMGSFDHSVSGDGSPGAPCVRIRGFSLWGSVGVKRKKRKPA